MSDKADVQVHWHEHAVSREERQTLNGHAGCVVWFTGLSACGKSTVANLLDHKLWSAGMQSFVLDGDNIRHGLNAAPAMLKAAAWRGVRQAVRAGLFRPGPRGEHPPHRGGGQALLRGGRYCHHGVHQPLPGRPRPRPRRRLRPGDFVEIFVDAPIEVCEARDPKGLYKKARAGELEGFYGH